MKSIPLKLVLFLFTPLCTLGQQAVQVGSGSYAEYPAQAVFYDFATTTNIMVKPNETRPIPSNDWWTHWIYSDSDLLGGRIWAYPLSINPESDGIEIVYPTQWNSSGSSMVIEDTFRITGESFSPSQSIVQDWSDWTVTAGFTDGSQSLELTAGHGMPFVWMETSNFMPRIEFDTVSFSDELGQAVSFPAVTDRLVFRCGDAYYGLHVPAGSVLDYSGTESMTIDLGTLTDIDEIVLHWETAYGSAYTIEFSPDNVTYSSVVNVSNGDGGVDTHTVTGAARYVRIIFIEQATPWDYSLWEVEVMSAGINVAEDQPITVTSENDYRAENAVDGNLGTRWQASSSNDQLLTITYPQTNGYVVISALTAPGDLPFFDQYARTKPTGTTVSWDYEVANGTLSTAWDITTIDLDTVATGSDPVLQGFIPHHYRDADTGFSFSGHEFPVARGTLKLAAGNHFTFDYPFSGILPHITKPFRDPLDAAPYDELIMSQLVSEYADSILAKTSPYGSDTYWGGKDLVRIARYLLIAKELGHPDYDTLLPILKAAFDDWLTYTPGEEARYFAWYPSWQGLVGFNESYYSGLFTDNHFHYGYFIQAAALLSMCDPDFVQQYEPMLTLVAKQYANWDHADPMFPFLRTMDPWIGHSYAGGLSSGNGNNQESTSEAMQSWAALYLLGNALNNTDMRAAGAFGYASESRATMEYWFDIYGDIFPTGYDHPLVGILWNAGNAYGTYFGAEPYYIHGIQMLPYGTYMNYLAMGWDRTSATEHYDALLVESYDYLVNESLPGASNKVSSLQAELDIYLAIPDPTQEELDAIADLESQLFYAQLSLTDKEEKAADGILTIGEIGTDWGNVLLGWLQIFNPERVAGVLAEYWVSTNESEHNLIHSPYTGGLTYYYTHASQNYGTPLRDYYMTIPSGQAFYKEATGETTFIVYNPETNDVLCTVYHDGSAVDAFMVPALSTYNSRYPEGVPSHTLPDGWFHGDVGAVAMDGGAAALGAALSINSDGAGINGSADAFHYVYQTGEGDLTVLARIAAFDGMNSGANTGVMLRDALDGDAPNVYVGISGDGTLFMQYRAETGTNTVTVGSVPGQAAPLWLKLDRELDLFTGAYSLDGANWVDIGSITLTLNAEVYGGVAAASGTATVSSYAMASFTTAIDGRVEAEDYSAAYNVQTQTTQDVDGNLNVGWIDAGDWMSYTLNMPTSGTHTVAFRVASPIGSQLSFETQDGYSATLAIPNTGDFQNWTTIQLENVPVPAGVQTFTIYAIAGSWNINWFSFTYIGPLAGGTDPVVPTGLTASDASALDRIDIEWGPVEGEYAYDVWRSSTTNPAAASIIATNRYNTYSDYAVSAGASYTYWVSIQGKTDPAWFSSSDQGSTLGASASMIFSITNGAIHLEWPEEYTGWQMQMQTNNLGTNWFPYPGSTGTNVLSVPIAPEHDSAFFRLIYPPRL